MKIKKSHCLRWLPLLINQFWTSNLRLLLGTVGSDGLLKVWDIKLGEAIGTFDAHEDKIWAVTYSEQTQEIITTGRDGNIFFWSDKTEEHKEKEREKSNELIKTEQTLSNYLQSGKLDKALRLSLR